MIRSQPRLPARAHGPDGWHIETHQMEVAAHYWLASVTMYLLLRALVRRPAPALLGSLIWTYGGFLTGYPMLQPSIAEGLAWLPLALLGVHLSLTAPRWRVRGILLSGGALALTFLAGHPQTATYAVYLALAYLAFTGWQLGLRLGGSIWRGALLGLVSAGLAAVQLLPAYELLQHSYRAENYHYLDKATGFTFTELIQVIWPRLFDANWWPLYPGVLALLLVILALVRPAARHRVLAGGDCRRAVAGGRWGQRRPRCLLRARSRLEHLPPAGAKRRRWSPSPSPW
ncbi:MAG: YfhO family protein [Anaerolineae bacterium]|nr:YfhO family protein [Anaerolineae bacterium]